MKQKFQRGDLVKVWGAREGVVLGSYFDVLGGDPEAFPRYAVHFRKEGPEFWFYQNEMALLEKGREDLLAEWRAHEPANSAG